MGKLTDVNLSKGIREAALAAVKLIDKQVPNIRQEIERKLATKKESETCDYTVTILCEMKIDLDSGEISPNGKLKWGRADGVAQQPGNTVPLDYVPDPDDPDLFEQGMKPVDGTTPNPADTPDAKDEDKTE